MWLKVTGSGWGPLHSMYFTSCQCWIWNWLIDELQLLANLIYGNTDLASRNGAKSITANDFLCTNWDTDTNWDTVSVVIITWPRSVSFRWPDRSVNVRWWKVTECLFAQMKLREYNIKCINVVMTLSLNINIVYIIFEIINISAVSPLFYSYLI